jgi:plastocyanin
MTRELRHIRLSLCVVLLLASTSPRTVRAQMTWNVLVGAQTHDKAIQASAFLPNEIWIHAGDTITWRFDADDIHTVTFLTAGQVRPPFPVGCPGFSSSPATFDGSACVTTPPLVTGGTFAVNFPATGNFKVVCLVHPNMTGVVHVLGASQPFPHDQVFYDRQASAQTIELLTDHDRGGQRPHAGHQSAHVVAAGTGEVAATAGGTSTVSVMRFVGSPTIIRAGETVEWDNLSPVEPHTITFGTEPADDPAPPSATVTIDQDGARHAIINSPSTSAHSGFIVAAPQDRIGLPQSPPGVTRFRASFPHPGLYRYICAIHDELGMIGEVIVK